MAQDCGILISLRSVITTVSKPRGLVLRASAFPQGSHYEIPAVAMLFNVSRRRIWNLISVHRRELDPPRYRLKHWRRHRVLSPRDFDILTRIFQSYVKENR